MLTNNPLPFWKDWLFRNNRRRRSSRICPSLTWTSTSACKPHTRHLCDRQVAGCTLHYYFDTWELPRWNRPWRVCPIWPNHQKRQVSVRNDESELWDGGRHRQRADRPYLAEFATWKQTTSEQRKCNFVVFHLIENNCGHIRWAKTIMFGLPAVKSGNSFSRPSREAFK